MLVEAHYEIRQITINLQLKDSPVQLNVGIRYRNAEGEQVGPEGGMDVTLEDPKLTARAQGRGRPVWDEDDVVREAKRVLDSEFVVLVEPPAPEEEPS